MERIQDGDRYCYNFSQSRLINNILDANGMTKCYGKPTHTVSELPLRLESRSKMAEEHFEYLSIIGMLSYLTNNCPEIAFAINQCNRYTHSYRFAYEGA
eukprot:13724173-Ditylum_brightwellii.AAC.1